MDYHFYNLKRHAHIKLHQKQLSNIDILGTNRLTFVEQYAFK